MEKFAFVSRHTPTPEQIRLAQEFDDPELGEGIELVHVGDMDAFSISKSQIYSLDTGPFVGVVVVHPAAAMRLAEHFLIGVFENSARAAVDGKPSFEAKELHVYDLRG